jgi:S-adenosylmethionine:tRNA ribosyltransferase-isomerase
LAVFGADFDYELPEAAVAQAAIEPRDAARLLVASSLEDRTFRDLPGLLVPEDLLVVNRTRVRPARLRGHKAPSGGAIELLLSKRIDADRWEALIRPARRIRAGQELRFGDIRGLVLTDPDRGVVTVALEAGTTDVDDALGVDGEVPLPPYFRGSLATPDRYQTMFAKAVGSAAAPTAGLHFTPSLAEDLRERGIGIAEVDLEVGLDTFRPMEAGPIADHRMHRERFSVPAATVEAIERTRHLEGRVVAVGTTVVRSLETAAGVSGLTAGEAESGLFITPGYRLRVVDAVITNFHAPRTTLLVMIAALLGPRWREVYAHALDGGYRFLSFGDAMFIDEPVNAR